jgi:hypothetical protein
MITILPRYTSAAVAIAAITALPSYAFAEGNNAPTCDRIAKDVRESVEKDRAKVLMIVEDALVINESCACEIVKAAIAASNADEVLVKQIVQTSIAVAPKMTAVIEECAGSPLSSTPAPVSTNSGKSGKDVQPVNPESSGKNGVTGDQGIQPPLDGTPGSGGANGNFSGSSPDLRGLYLIQPATGVFGGGGSTTVRDPENRNNRRRDDAEERKKKRRPTVIVPTSPTSASMEPK